MRLRLTAMLLTFIPLGLAPIAALAAECGDYPLTQDQLNHLTAQQLDIVIPDGEVPVIQRCDIDGNNTVDIFDIRAIAYARNNPAAHPDDPMDWDRNGQIDILDARGCQQVCANPRCAVSAQEPEELEGGIVETAECFQAEDFDGDGEEDLVAVFQHTGPGPRYFDWTLEVLILSKDADGNVRHTLFPFTGQKSSATGDLAQHLSSQPAGIVNLNPGVITINKPGVVSYRNGKPEVLYYFDNNGILAQAFYGVDD